MKKRYWIPLCLGAFIVGVALKIGTKLGEPLVLPVMPCIIDSIAIGIAGLILIGISLGKLFGREVRSRPAGLFPLVLTALCLVTGAIVLYLELRGWW